MQREVYVVEAVLMSFLLGVVEAGSPEQAQTVVHQVLDLLWLFMEVRPGRGRCGEVLEKAARTPGLGCPWRLTVQPDRLFQDYEVQDCLKQLMMSLLRLYRFSPIVPDLSLQVGAPAPGPEPPQASPPPLSTLSPQIRYLRLTIAILSHQKSRKFLLSNVLYPPLAARQARPVVHAGASRGPGRVVCPQPGLPMEAQEGQSHLASGLSLPALSLQSKEGSAARRWARCHPHLRSSAKAPRFYLWSMAGVPVRS